MSYCTLLYNYRETIPVFMTNESNKDGDVRFQEKIVKNHFYKIFVGTDKIFAPKLNRLNLDEEFANPDMACGIFSTVQKDAVFTECRSNNKQLKETLFKFSKLRQLPPIFALSYSYVAGSTFPMWDAVHSEITPKKVLELTRKYNVDLVFRPKAVDLFIDIVNRFAKDVLLKQGEKYNKSVQDFIKGYTLIYDDMKNRLIFNVLNKYNEYLADTYFLSILMNQKFKSKFDFNSVFITSRWSDTVFPFIVTFKKGGDESTIKFVLQILGLLRKYDNFNVVLEHEFQDIYNEIEKRNRERLIIVGEGKGE